MPKSKSRLLKDLRDFNYIAKGELTDIEEIDGAIYIFGSELGCLRLYKYYTKANKDLHVNVDYSDNLGKWFFTYNWTS